MPFSPLHAISEKKNDYYSKLRAAAERINHIQSAVRKSTKIPTDPTHAAANVSVFALWNGAARGEGSGYHTDDCAIG